MSSKGAVVMEQESKIVRTMCPMSCHPTLCGMLAEVRNGQLLSVRGDKANPDSQGFLCVRGQASREVIGNAHRLLRPLVRDHRSDPFRVASWDDALERIALAMGEPERVGIWPGHGVFTTNYGTRISGQLMARFANFHGSHFWNPTMVCWGLGAFGLGLTGLVETHTKEDMGLHAQLIVLWAANLASQPNTARHVLAAKRRGAYVVTIDVRRTEAAAKSDEVVIIRPGSDTALALAMMHVICAEGLEDRRFIAAHTIGFESLAAHLQPYTPVWAETTTGVCASQIVALARRYAGTRPAMIVLGGSSLHKGENGWHAGRAISCLPGLTGNVGIPGGGLGPRHGSKSHGTGLANITAPERRVRSPIVPNQMSEIVAALQDGRIHTLLLMGTNMLSSFAESGTVAAGLARAKMVVSYDLFLNDTARQYADVVLPGTAWLEELGCKMTNTHLYLMEQALEPPGETRSLYAVLTGLAARLGLDGYDAWCSAEAMIDALLDHRATGHATVASLRATAGIGALDISHIAHPDLVFDTPSGKLEFHSGAAEQFGLPPLPTMPDVPRAARGENGEAYPLALAQGRTINHFHGFYNNGKALPSLARLEQEPQLWIGPEDAAKRALSDGNPIRIFNERGSLLARAHVTEKIPAGTVWMRDGWPGLNRLTSGVSALPTAAVDLFAFAAGQAGFNAMVEVAAAFADE